MQIQLKHNLNQKARSLDSNKTENYAFSIRHAGSKTLKFLGSKFLKISNLQGAQDYKVPTMFLDWNVP